VDSESYGLRRLRRSEIERKREAFLSFESSFVNYDLGRIVSGLLSGNAKSAIIWVSGAFIYWPERRRRSPTSWTDIRCTAAAASSKS
jgi:hypothetical protein